MRKLIVTLGVTSLLLTAVFGANAHAGDAKSIGGNVCNALFGSQQQDVRYRGSSIENESSSFRWVSCAMTRDDTSNTDGLYYARVWIKNQSIKKSRCSLLAYSPEGSIIDFDGDQGQGDVNLVMSLSASAVDGTFSLQCYMPPGARLLTIRYEER